MTSEASRTNLKLKRLKAESAGFCNKCCFRRPVIDGKRCQVCRNQHNAAKAKKILRGLCSGCCVNKAEAGYKTCTACLGKSRSATRQIWLQIVEHYGGCCACCGEREIVFLTVDHKNNDGAAHRRSLGIPAGFKFYRWLVDAGFPADLQLLCYNCNCSKQRVGECPHETARRKSQT